MNYRVDLKVDIKARILFLKVGQDINYILRRNIQSHKVKYQFNLLLPTCLNR